MRLVRRFVAAVAVAGMALGVTLPHASAGLSTAVAAPGLGAEAMTMTSVTPSVCPSDNLQLVGKGPLAFEFDRQTFAAPLAEVTVVFIDSRCTAYYHPGQDTQVAINATSGQQRLYCQGAGTHTDQRTPPYGVVVSIPVVTCALIQGPRVVLQDFTFSGTFIQEFQVRLRNVWGVGVVRLQSSPSGAGVPASLGAGVVDVYKVTPFQCAGDYQLLGKGPMTLTVDGYTVASTSGLADVELFGRGCPTFPGGNALIFLSAASGSNYVSCEGVGTYTTSGPSPMTSVVSDPILPCGYVHGNQLVDEGFLNFSATFRITFPALVPNVWGVGVIRLQGGV